MKIPRLVLAALKGGAGKTFLTAGIIAALRERGVAPAVFKKGPDYIDAGWLGFAAREQSRNLDTFMCGDRPVLESFLRHSAGRDAAIVEGNRGLFDGVDHSGSYSTAELAKLLQAPVILIVDATKVTRTAAAMVVGCQALDPDLNIAAVILNRVAGARHESVLRESIEQAAGVPVIGSVKKLSLHSFPQRHLGLLPLHEHPAAQEFLDTASQTAQQSIDLDHLMDIASSAPDLADQASAGQAIIDAVAGRGIGPIIGVVRDSAFQFYYPDNLEALQERGARIVEVSALRPEPLPLLDALYIGGGFPETHARQLADNAVFKQSLRSAVDKGLPVYAECGGLMFLARGLRIDDTVYPMADIFPVECVLQRRPQGHGYIQVVVTGPNPFYPEGTAVTGHEFHYSILEGLDEPGISYAFSVTRGYGMDGRRDGMCAKNVLGTYVHVHALGVASWADGLVEKARWFRTLRQAGRQ